MKKEKKKRKRRKCTHCNTTDHEYSKKRCPYHKDPITGLPDFSMKFCEDIDAEYNEFFGGVEEVQRLEEKCGKNNLQKYFRAQEHPEAAAVAAVAATARADVVVAAAGVAASTRPQRVRRPPALP